MKKIKVLGLRVDRFAQWARVIREEGRRIAFHAMVWEMAKAVWRGVCAKRNEEARRRRRSAFRACLRCPVFDRGRGACRPYPGSPLGCGCYMPFKVAADGPCWGKESIPGFRWGYGEGRGGNPKESK